MKYLDLVELINEKPSYIKAGVKVGDFGAVKVSFTSSKSSILIGHSLSSSSSS